jgi:xanthine dehydrogenase small subunit
VIATGLEVLRPASVKQALQLLREAHEAGSPLTPLAGGTDLFVVLNSALRTTARYLDLWGLDKLRRIDGDGKSRLTLGGGVTYSDCIGHAGVRKRLPILAVAARQIGGVQIQNRGTLAGNIENGSPAADAVPVLMAADATVILRSVDGERAVPLAQYYVGYRRTVRRPDELIVRLELDVPAGPQRFRKVGTRAAQAISKIAMATVGHRVAFGSVAPTVVRAQNLETYAAMGGRDAEEAQRLALSDVKPIDDVRSTAEYRRRVVANLVADWIGNLDA